MREVLRVTSKAYAQTENNSQALGFGALGEPERGRNILPETPRTKIWDRPFSVNRTE